MAQTLEELFARGANTVTADGQNYRFTDADTLQDEKGQRYRLAGVNAPETAHGAAPEKGQEYGATAATEETAKLANSMGFSQMLRTGEIDPFGREIVDLVNPETGEHFSKRLINEGVQDIHHAFDDGNVLLEGKEWSQFLNANQQPDDWDKARMAIDEAADNEGKRQDFFKQQQRYSGQIGDLRELKDMFLQRGDRAGAFNVQQQIDTLSQTNDAEVKRFDRDNVTGNALNPWSDSWNKGLIGVSESAYGIAELLGNKVGSEGLQQLGEDGVARARARAEEGGKLLLDYKDVDGFWSGIDYLGNNLAMSLPYMGITAVGAVAGAASAPIVGGAAALGVGLSAPSAVYAGQVWNEMEGEAHEKNATIAIGTGVAQATLDRLGLTAIFKKGVAPQKLMNDAIAELMKRGASKEAAEQTVMAASRKEIAGLAGDAAKVASQQLTAKARFKDFASSLGIGASGEALTEAAQEAIGYTGAKLGGKDGLDTFDWNELNERAITAAIAGGSLGGVLSIPGTTANTLGWVDVAAKAGLAEESNESQSAIYAAQEKSKLGYVPSIEENIAKVKLRTQTGASFQTLNDRRDDYQSSQKSKSWSDRATESALNVSSLWQGATRNIFTPSLQSRSRSARVLADMFGGNLQRVYSGSSFESSKHHRVAVYKNMLMDPNNFYVTMGRGKRASRKQKQAISDQTYNVLQSAVDKDGNFNADLIPDTNPDKQLLLKLGTELNNLSDKMWKDQRKHNPDLGYINNYLFKYKSIDKGSVNKNRVKFQNLLQSEYKYNANDAKKLVDEILNNNEVHDVEDAFSVAKGGIVPGSHRGRSLAMSENKAFQEFMDQDLFSNVATAVKSAARYTAHRDYIGKDGEVVSKLLDDMENEGIPKEEVNKVASQIRDYLDAESGNYKRPQSELGQKFQRVQKNIMMATTLSGLPLATISSFVELMLVNKGLTKDQIFGKQGSLQQMGKDLSNTLWDGMKYTGGMATAKDFGESKVFETGSKELLKDLGYYEWDVGAATVTGVTEVNSWQRGFYESFFKVTGLTGWTNYTRAVRASVGGDYIAEKTEAIWKQRQTGEPRNREIQEAEEALRNLGLDVDQYVQLSAKMRAGMPFNEQEQQAFDTGTREALYTWVNDAIALPQSANRPLIYQDPRFALFTQFQGFIATFTANHIPKLWGEYVKRGTPAMKYNAFATMVTMIMMGFASQHLKDIIKYGFGDDEDERLTGENPYLDTPEYIQRGIRASGLLGTGERALEFMFPLYEQRSDGVGDWVFNTSTGESPALSYLKRGFGGVEKTLSGDVTGGAKDIARLAPGVGPFGQRVENALDDIGGWKFKGE